jgi:hypothetical protein
MKKNTAFSHSLHGNPQDTNSVNFPLPTPD